MKYRNCILRRNTVCVCECRSERVLSPPAGNMVMNEYVYYKLNYTMARSIISIAFVVPIVRSCTGIVNVYLPLSPFVDCASENALRLTLHFVCFCCFAFRMI